VDDGKTLFAAANARATPFDQNGKQAVKAYVYICGDHRWVQCLEKGETGTGDGFVLRKPGTPQWIPDNDPRVTQVRQPSVPTAETPTPDLPSSN